MDISCSQIAERVTVAIFFSVIVAAAVQTRCYSADLIFGGHHMFVYYTHDDDFAEANTRHASTRRVIR